MSITMVKKIVISVILSFMCLALFATTYVEASMYTNMTSDASNFIKKGADQDTIDYGKVTDEFVQLGQILTMMGAGILVGVTAYMGIKYLISGPEAQAKLKTQLIGVVVSGIVIFGAFQIWQIVLKVAAKF